MPRPTCHHDLTTHHTTLLFELTVACQSMSVSPRHSRSLHQADYFVTLTLEILYLPQTHSTLRYFSTGNIRYGNMEGEQFDIEDNGASSFLTNHSVQSFHWTSLTVKVKDRRSRRPLNLISEVNGYVQQGMMEAVRCGRNISKPC